MTCANNAGAHNAVETACTQNKLYTVPVNHFTNENKDKKFHGSAMGVLTVT